MPKKLNISNKKQALYSIETALIARNYLRIEQEKHTVARNVAAVAGKHYIKNAPLGVGIFGAARRAAFLVLNQAAFERGLVIECLWLDEGSTGEHRLPLLLYNIRKSATATCVVLDGDGVRPPMKKWIAAQATAPENRYLVNVLTMAEFARRIDNGFLS